MDDTELIDYFKSLGVREILGLARKSIQITANNISLMHNIEDLEDSGKRIRLALTKKGEKLKETEHKLDDIKKIAEQDLQENHCNNCDGVGLPECQNDKCSTYQMNEILKILER